MENFGATIRKLRQAQELGLRETAGKVGISPAYLSRIERDKERPPRPQVIRKLAQTLAADPDALFRLSASTDPEIVSYLNERPIVMNLLRFIQEGDFSDAEVRRLLHAAKEMDRNRIDVEPPSLRPDSLIAGDETSVQPK
jgi:transcriptional regulator with XRE-family HTH domain